MASSDQSVSPPPDQQHDSKLATAQTDEKGPAVAAAAEEMAVPDDWEPMPLDPNYKTPGLRFYRYRGFVTFSFHLQWGLMEEMPRFRGRPSDIIIAGFPRSGNTWLEEIVWRVTHVSEAADGSGSGVPLEYHYAVLGVRSHDEYLKFTSVDEMLDPRFIRTHQHYRNLPESIITSGAKVLYVSRDARDVCVSYYHFCRMTRIFQYRGTFKEYRDSFVRGNMLYGPYREHVKGYLEHSDTVLCLTYEEMQQDRASVVRKVADFLGVNLTDADVDNIVRNTSFEVMKANPDTNFQQWEKSGMISDTSEGPFIRKGVVGDWRNYFTEEEDEAFMEWRNEEVTSL